MATVEDFLTLDVRVGTVVAAEALRGARKPAFVLEVDFGAIGRRRSSAQITDLYEASDLVGLQVIAVLNLPPRQVAGLSSEVLVLSGNEVVLSEGDNVLVGCQLTVQMRTGEAQVDGCKKSGSTTGRVIMSITPGSAKSN